MTESEIKSLLSKNYKAYSSIKDEGHELVAIGINWKVLGLIDSPTEEMIDKAISQNGHAIQFVKNPSADLQLRAILSNPTSIQHIVSPTKEAQILAVNKNQRAILSIANSCEEAQIIALKKYLNYFFLIENLTEGAIEYAISKSAKCLKLIPNPTPRMIDAALRSERDAIISNIPVTLTYDQLKILIANNPMAIWHINDPSEELQLLAIQGKHSGRNIYYIKNPTDKVIHMAIDLDPYAIGGIKKQTAEIAKYALDKKLNVYPYVHIRVPKRYQLAIVKRFKNSLGSIVHPCPTVIKYLFDKNRINTPEDAKICIKYTNDDSIKVFLALKYGL